LAAAGEKAEGFLSGEEHINTPCGKGGAYYRLWERDAQILMIGVNFTRNTFIHGIEEWDKAIGAISADKTDMYVVDYQGNRLYTPQYRHCSPLGSDTFGKLEAPALHNGVMKMGYFGDADTRLMRAKSLRALAAVHLEDDPRYLLKY